MMEEGIRKYLGNKKNLHYIIGWIGVFILAFTHLYRITSVPFGLNIDEAGSCYDAWSLAHFGVDRYLNSFPVYFSNFGSGQSALFVYLLMICFRFVRYSLWVPRILMSVACWITAFLGYKLIEMKYPKSVEKEIFLLLFGITPVIIMIFRVGMDATWMLCTSTVFLFVISKAVQTKKKYLYLLSGIAAGLVLYSYVLSYIVMPVFLLIFFIYIMKRSEGERKEELCRWIIMGLPLAIMALPLLMVQFVNILDIPTVHIGPFSFVNLPYFRGSDIAPRHAVRQFLQALYFNLFHDVLTYNDLPQFGVLYYISIPFLLVGVIDAIRQVRKKKDAVELCAIPLFWLLAEYIMGSMIDMPYTSRMNGVFAVFIYFIATGICKSIAWIKRKWNEKRATIFGIAVGIAYTICFVCFSVYYWGDYTEDTENTYPISDLFHYDLNEVMNYFEGEGNVHSTEPLYMYDRYIYYMLEKQISPYELQFDGTKLMNYGNVQFYYPSELDYSGNYLIRKNGEEDSREKLLKNGYREIEFSHWRLMLGPLVDVKKEYYGAEQGTLCTIDTLKMDDHGNVLFTGWIADVGKEEISNHGKIYLKMNEETVEAERIERPDVAGAYDLPEDLPYGFTVSIPFDSFQKMTNYSICDEDGEILAKLRRE